MLFLATKVWEQRKLSEMTQQVKRTSDSENPILTISAKNGWMDQKDRFNRVIAGKELKNYIELYKNELSYNHGNSKYAKFGIIYVQRKYEKALVPKVYHSFSMSYGDPRFTENLSLGHKLDKELSKLITSGARQDGLLNINKKSFYAIKLFIPSEQEQVKISNIMDIINHIITLYAKKSSCLDSCIAYFIRTFYDYPQFFKQKNVQNSIMKSFKLNDVLIKNNTRNKDLSTLNVESISNKKGFISQKEQFDNYQVASKDLSNYYVIHPKDFAYNPSRINVGSIAYKSLNDVKGIVSPYMYPLSVRMILS